MASFLPIKESYSHTEIPVPGLSTKIPGLIIPNFCKNQDDGYICPITYISFRDNSTIIAIVETGNLYSNEAFEESNK